MCFFVFIFLKVGWAYLSMVEVEKLYLLTVEEGVVKSS